MLDVASSKKRSLDLVAAPTGHSELQFISVDAFLAIQQRGHRRVTHLASQ